MDLVYFDTSALVKLVLTEDGSDLVATLWDGCSTAVSSRLSYPEGRAALAAANRDRRLSPRALGRAEQTWDAVWSDVLAIALTDPIARRAGELVKQHRLKGADGVHLASALAVPAPDCVMAVWDKRLHDSASAAGLAVAPAG